MPLTARIDRILLEGIVGSTAYGLATPTSDRDYTGIYVQPTADLLGLHPPSRARATRVSHGGPVDSSRHEIGKAMHLMLSCNPTASEILWLEDWTTITDFGRELVELRGNFLSASRARAAYFGYATSQFRRLIEYGRFGGSLETRREKHARHLMRLLWQGYQVYTTGHLPIRVEDPDAFHDFGRRIAADPEALAAKQLLAEYEHKFDTARTVLPEHPNEAPLEDLIQRVRRAHLHTKESDRVTELEAQQRPRVITDPAELDALPEGSIITTDGQARQSVRRAAGVRWTMVGGLSERTSEYVIQSSRTVLVIDEPKCESCHRIECVCCLDCGSPECVCPEPRRDMPMPVEVPGA